MTHNILTLPMNKLLLQTLVNRTIITISSLDHKKARGGVPQREERYI